MQDPWMEAMMRGDFAAAWRISDEVLERRRISGESCTHWPRHQQFIWTGAPLENKRVLVRCYHGLGDTLQFVRLLPLLRARARHIVLWLQPQLLSLASSLEGADEFLPLHDGASEAQYDVDIELMEIPHALRLQPADIPRRVPYIRVPAADLPRGRELRVGLVTASGDWNLQRSIPHVALTRLSRIDGVQWFSLQYPADTPPFPMSSIACRDIATMASRMRTLDLVITVDTMQAHLAGALGLTTWLLLNSNADWRWMRGRSDSPWYPTMRLFRQARPDEWDQVVAEVEDELLALTRARDIRSSGCTASSG